jgi:hypothetical protein
MRSMRDAADPSAKRRGSAGVEWVEAAFKVRGV